MNDSATKNVTASLEYLTGPARGTAGWLSGNTLDLLLSDKRLIQIRESGTDHHQGELVARLHRSEQSYEIEAVEGRPLWVNGVRTSAKRLESRDLIELGQNGPLTRFRLYSGDSAVRKSIADIVNDCIDYTRVSRQPFGRRVAVAVSDLMKNLTLQTTMLFRLVVLISIVALVATTFLQWRTNVRLQQQVESEALRLESFARSLARAQQEALRPADLNVLRQEMGRHLTEATERLEALEHLSGASGRVIAAAKHSIVFLQGAYGFRDLASGKMLRYMTDNEGRPLLSPLGQPMLTLEGDGPVAERHFTGTAFVITEDGVLLTNRHVALPWEDDASVETMLTQGLEPALTRFVGYLPDSSEVFDVSLLRASEEADLALLLCENIEDSIPSLALGDPPSPGDEVIVMGYPTGLRSMLAQTGNAFLQELQSGEDLDFWAVAARLAENHFIQPLASRGIVGQVSPSAIVYDAETTHGGSGGPVLDISGRVVAVNTAIIPEYGGSNLGVPVEYVRRLLSKSDVSAQ